MFPWVTSIDIDTELFWHTTVQQASRGTNQAKILTNLIFCEKLKGKLKNLFKVSSLKKLFARKGHANKVNYLDFLVSSNVCLFEGSSLC